eukprot:SAG22_NODE_1406_length_4490_cov_5.574357_6_plen_171_part_00
MPDRFVQYRCSKDKVVQVVPVPVVYSIWLYKEKRLRAAERPRDVDSRWRRCGSRDGRWRACRRCHAQLRCPVTGCAVPSPGDGLGDLPRPGAGRGPRPARRRQFAGADLRRVRRPAGEGRRGQSRREVPRAGHRPCEQARLAGAGQWCACRPHHRAQRVGGWHCLPWGAT